MTDAQPVRLLDDLHIRRTGRGLDLVLLHGWAMNGRVWDALVSELESDYRIHVVDLPGHGLSALSNGQLDLQNMADSILQAVTPELNGRAVWLGWSLGGLIATHIAVHASQWVNRLLLVATTPRFAKASDWPDAMDMDVLNNFAVELKQNYKTTLQRFLALQVKGSEDARKSLRKLKERLLTLPAPDDKALDAGLHILQQTDLREYLTQLSMPVQIVGGAQDMLIPAAAIPEIAGMISDSYFNVIPGAGHAPFISHPQIFIELLKETA